MPNRVILVDVDGTVFETLTNSPMKGAREALLALKRDKNAFIVYVTGRISNPEEDIRRAGFPCDTVIYRGAMPLPSWFWANADLKERVLSLFNSLGINVIAAFDNEPEVIEMYRRHGIPATKIVDSSSWANVSDHVSGYVW